jgi:hypothetical protein
MRVTRNRQTGICGELQQMRAHELLQVRWQKMKAGWIESDRSLEMAKNEGGICTGDNPPLAEFQLF